jgi:hypothetical protein
MYTNSGKTLQKVAYDNYGQLKSLCKNNACCYFGKDSDMKAFAKDTVGLIMKRTRLDTGKNADLIEDEAMEAMEANFRETMVLTRRIEQKTPFELLYGWDDGKEDLSEPP